MDTIIYLYHSREAEKFITEKWQKKEYCLIRLGIPQRLWKNLKILERGLEEGKATESEQALKRSKKNKWFAGRKRKRKPQSLEEALPTERIEAERKQRLQREIFSLLEELAELQTALCLLGDNPHWTYCVYEDFLKERIAVTLWEKYWSLPEFEAYYEYVWAEELMQYATGDSFLILGCAPCVGAILNRHVAKMRSVKWIMKPGQYTEAVQEFIESFYQENGLVISVQLLAEGEEWIRFRPSDGKALNVLDFSGEEKLSACDIARGSIWLDMNSLEGKERRMEARCPQIGYFSLKKHWKSLQKSQVYLDTIAKNGYNTLVN